MLAQRSASQLKGSLRQKLTQQIFALGPAYTQSESSGELVNATVEGVEVLDEYITSYQPARLLAMLVPAFVLVVIFLLDPPTTLILLFTGPILVLLLAFIGSRAKEITEQRFLELSWMSAFFLDMLQGLATLKMFGRSREQIDNIRDDQPPLRQHHHGSAAHRLSDRPRAGMGRHGGHGARRRSNQPALDEPATCPSIARWPC